MADYHSLENVHPLEKGDYLCRLLDNKQRVFYRVLTWYGVAFWDGMVKHGNVTHWAEVPTWKSEAMRKELGTGWATSQRSMWLLLRGA